MGRQIGKLKISGTFDGLTYYSSIHGYIVRRESGFKSAKLKNDPAFEKSRQTAQEFRLANASAKLLREALQPFIAGSTDRFIHTRLLSKMLSLKKLDTRSKKGKRNINKALLLPSGKETLTGFEFNGNCALRSILHGITFKGTAVQLLHFTPATSLKPPSGATHFSIHVAHLSINLKTKAHTLAETAYKGAMDDPLKKVLLPLKPKKLKGATEVILLKIKFSQHLNGINYPLHEAAHKPCAVIAVL